MGVTMVVNATRKPYPGPREWVSVVVWEGCTIEIESDTPCDPAHCALEVMHHYDDEGRHYCPTGLLFCGICCGTAEEPGEPRCTRWGEADDREASPAPDYQPNLI